MVSASANARKCLLVVDVQAGLFELPRPLFAGNLLLETVGGLLSAARATGSQVVFVQHSSGEHGLLATGSDGWRIHPAVAPLRGEPVVQKTHCDAFQGTGLEALLRRGGAGRVVVCGLVTEGCVDTTIRRAFSLGFGVEVPCDGHSTTDSAILTGEQIVRHHNEVFRIFGEVTEAKRIVFPG